MLELAILGVLKERAMHGYELRKQLSQRLGFFWTVSFGSLYPTLKKLERRGVVEKVAPPDQTSRRKQVYRITPAGEREFLDLLEEGATSASDEEKFPLRLAFFRYLKPEIRIRLLERRKAYLEDRLVEGRSSLSRARRGRADTYTLSLMRHGVDVTTHDIAWLDELITAERAVAPDRDALEGRSSWYGADDLDPRPPSAGSQPPQPDVGEGGGQRAAEPAGARVQEPRAGEHRDDHHDEHDDDVTRAPSAH